MLCQSKYMGNLR